MILPYFNHDTTSAVRQRFGLIWFAFIGLTLFSLANCVHFILVPSLVYFTSKGSTFRKKPWGKLAPKILDLVTNKSISISEKQRKLVACEIGDPSGRNVELCFSQQL